MGGGLYRMMENEIVEDGISLLVQGKREMTLSDAMNMIEVVTKDPYLARRILEEAEKMEIIERKGSVIRSSTGMAGDYKKRMKIKHGNFTCNRCGSGLVKGYFIITNDKEWGPFGPTCVKKIMGF